MVVVAAVGEPGALLPPLVYETVGRDISDLVFERLADLQSGRPTLDPAAYTPALAERWEQVDSVTWRFHLRPAATWHDGRPVTAYDVAFSFEAFRDSILDPLPRQQLDAVLASVAAADSATVVVRFRRPYPEQLYDATYHVRVIPRHLWDSLPREEWAADTALARLVGSGAFRVASWQRGQAVTLEAVAAEVPETGVRRVVWRFTGDPEAALNLVLSHEADVIETVNPAGAERAAEDTALRLLPYPSAAYGFLGFRVAAPSGRTHPVLSDRTVRRALVQALDRATMARAVFGPETRVPPGPMSQLLWIWDTKIATLRFDTAAAAAALESAGWRRGPDGIRARGNRPLRLEILVPSTSTARRRLAEAIQEAWRGAGVAATVSAVDMPIFQQRLGRGEFDAYLGAWLDEPSPRGLADQWTRAGWDVLNYGRYVNPVFDSLLARAGTETDPAAAGRLWREAMDTLNADAPAAFLFAPTNIAVVSTRFNRVMVDPFSWLRSVGGWEVVAP